MKNIFVFFTPIRLLIAQAGVSSAMLGAALVAQYGFELHPCELCLYQRYPYVAIIVVVLLALIMCRSAKSRIMAAMLCAALFFIDGGIAFYHSGVELGWFEGPSACSSTSSGPMSLEEMRRQIMQAPLVSCSQAMAHIAGLSLAAWNAIAAFGCGVASVMIVWWGKRHAA
ncbi:MAG: disulfide bond formation protein B [Rickettsiales bacterium]|nr:disulfide bond formation protein B [Rickettsiales bacterium]